MPFGIWLFQAFIRSARSGGTQATLIAAKTSAIAVIVAAVVAFTALVLLAFWRPGLPGWLAIGTAFAVIALGYGALGLPPSPPRAWSSSGSGPAPACRLICNCVIQKLISTLQAVTRKSGLRPVHRPNRASRTASTAAAGPVTSTWAAARRPNKKSSSSPGGPAMQAAGFPRRARTVRAVPAHWSSRPVPRSRRVRYQGATPTLRHRASSMAGSSARGPRPLARRTSSWWTKNSFRLGSRRTHPVRKKPAGGPARNVATSQVKSLAAKADCRRPAKRAQAPGSTSPGPAIVEPNDLGRELVTPAGFRDVERVL